MLAFPFILAALSLFVGFAAMALFDRDRQYAGALFLLVSGVCFGIGTFYALRVFVEGVR